MKIALYGKPDLIFEFHPDKVEVCIRDDEKIAEAEPTDVLDFALGLLNMLTGHYQVEVR